MFEIFVQRVKQIEIPNILFVHTAKKNQGQSHREPYVFWIDSKGVPEVQHSSIGSEGGEVKKKQSKGKNTERPLRKKGRCGTGKPNRQINNSTFDLRQK